MLFELAIAGSTVLLILILTRVATFFDLLDYPDSNIKQHDSPTPIIGGITILFVMLGVLLLSDRPPKLDMLVLCAGAIAVIGFVDDLMGLPVWIRVVGQVVVGSIMALGAGVLFETLGPVAGYTLVLPQHLQILLTVGFVVVTMNAVNMSDGIDGNAAGLVLIGLGLIAVGQLLTVGEVRKPNWLTALVVSVAVFWVVNVSLTPARKIFLGDAGTLSLGLILSWLCLDFSQGPGRSIHPVMVGWVLLVPLADFIGVFILRVISGRLPTMGGREHLHHILVDKFDDNYRTALVVLLGVAGNLGCIGMILTALDPLVGLLLLLSVIAVSGFYQVRHGMRSRELKNASR